MTLIENVAKKGLESIFLASAASRTGNDSDIARRARVFYFNRCVCLEAFCLFIYCCNRMTGRSITIDQARQAEATSSSNNIANVEQEEVQVQGMSPIVESSVPSTQENQDPNKEEPRPLTFAELQELIESGREDLIPNNKVIPDRLSVCYSSRVSKFLHLTFVQDDLPSSSAAPVRKKPWEIRAMEPKVEA